MWRGLRCQLAAADQSQSCVHSLLFQGEHFSHCQHFRSAASFYKAAAAKCVHFFPVLLREDRAAHFLRHKAERPWTVQSEFDTSVLQDPEDFLVPGLRFDFCLLRCTPRLRSWATHLPSRRPLKCSWSSCQSANKTLPHRCVSLKPKTMLCPFWQTPGHRGSKSKSEKNL